MEYLFLGMMIIGVAVACERKGKGKIRTRMGWLSSSRGSTGALIYSLQPFNSMRR